MNDKDRQMPYSTTGVLSQNFLRIWVGSGFLQQDSSEWS